MEVGGTDGRRLGAPGGGGLAIAPGKLGGEGSPLSGPEGLASDAGCRMPGS